MEPARRQWLGRLSLYAVGMVGLPLVFFLVGLRNVYDYGETSDESAVEDVGRFYTADYPETGFANLEARLDPLLRNYGALWAIVDAWSADALMNRTGWIKDETAAHHLPVLVVSSLSLGVVFLIGTLASGFGCGFASQLVLVLMPQFVGHSQNNSKDQPVAFFFALAMLGFVVAWRRGSLILWALAGALGGAAYAAKINGVFALPVAGLWMLPFIVRDGKRLPVWLLRFTLATAAFVLTVPLLWPYYRARTLSRFLETAAAFREHDFNELVYYLGRHIPAREIPWHFPLVMFGITTPLVVIGLALFGFGMLAKLLARRRLDEAGPLLLFSVWFCFPILAQLAAGAYRCDGVRHYLYLLPALALLAGTGAVGLWRWAEDRGLGPRALRMAVFALPALLLFRTLVAIHPYEVVFFNGVVGGAAGASRNFELDYGGTSLLEASRWMDANLPSSSRLWFTQAGLHRFKLKNASLHFVGADDRPNYKISLRRGLVKTYDTDDDYLHPRRKIVHEIAVEGAPILQIFAMEENADVAEGATLVPPPFVPARPAPGLRATLSVDNKPPESLAAQERLFIDCADGRYRDRNTDLRASGFLHVTAPGPYVFELRSDDSATIWLGKDALITNASMATTRRRVVLARGYYPIRLKYHNDLGAACLGVRWRPPGAAGLTEVAAPALLHDAAATGEAP